MSHSNPEKELRLWLIQGHLQKVSVAGGGGCGKLQSLYPDLPGHNPTIEVVLINNAHKIAGSKILGTKFSIKSDGIYHK